MALSYLRKTWGDGWMDGWEPWCPIENNWSESDKPWIGWYILLDHPSIHVSIRPSVHPLVRSLFHPPCGTLCPSPLVWLFGCKLCTAHDCTTMQRGVKHKRLKTIIIICHNSTRASIATLLPLLFLFSEIFRKARFNDDNHWSNEATYVWMILQSSSKYGHNYPKNHKKIQSFMIIGGCSSMKDQRNVLFLS